jgi:iron complex outermembrane recepter protein
VSFVPEPDGFEVSATYWSIVQDPRIQQIALAVLLANEANFPDRIIRAAPTPADVAAGRPGRLLSIVATSLNFGRLETSGVDVRVSDGFRIGRGRLSLSLLGTWIDQYSVADVPNTTAVDRVGVAHTQGTIPKWRGSGTIGWEQNGFAISASARHASSYDDVTALLVRNGRSVDAQTLVDFQSTLRLDELFTSGGGWLSGVVLRAGVVNAFDEEPQFSEMFGFGSDPSQADLRQRFTYVSLAKTF